MLTKYIVQTMLVHLKDYTEKTFLQSLNEGLSYQIVQFYLLYFIFFIGLQKLVNFLK